MGSAWKLIWINSEALSIIFLKNKKKQSNNKTALIILLSGAVLV